MRYVFEFHAWEIVKRLRGTFCGIVLLIFFRILYLKFLYFCQKQVLKVLHTFSGNGLVWHVEEVSACL